MDNDKALRDFLHEYVDQFRENERAKKEIAEAALADASRIMGRDFKEEDWYSYLSEAWKKNAEQKTTVNTLRVNGSQLEVGATNERAVDYVLRMMTQSLK